ncbi:MAG: T9SS type A sorting domain-containing protein [Bacteroidota bacterium]
MRFPLVIIAFALFAVQLFAQPKDLGYESPAGWTYIMNLDSVDVIGMHVHNDTMVLSAESRRIPTPEQGRFFTLYSLNGGSTWDTLVPEKEADNVNFLIPDQYFPNSNKLYRMIFTQDTSTLVRLVSFKISEDLGRTFTTRYDYDTVMSRTLEGRSAVMQFHPLAPDEGFYVRSSNSVFFSVFRTHDGGKTWQYQPLPPPRDGRGVYYQILPDIRNPKTWNVWVNGADHSWVDDFYQTRDDGKSFSYIDQWGEYAGIGYEGEVRSWWKKDYYSNIGIISSGDKGDSVKIPWLKRMAPEKPDPDFDNEYYYTIYDGNYKFLEHKPDTAFTGVWETKWEKGTDSIKLFNSYIYRTYNDGETWENIWNSPISANRIYVDQKLETVWTVTADYRPKKFNDAPNNLPLYSLYKQQIHTSIEDKKPNNNSISNLSISPNPAENQTRIEYTNTKSGKVKIILYDILGIKIRTIYSGIQEAGEQKILWNIPAAIPSGTYFLKLESGGQSVTEKIVITR